MTVIEPILLVKTRVVGYDEFMRRLQRERDAIRQNLEDIRRMQEESQAWEQRRAAEIASLELANANRQAALLGALGILAVAVDFADFPSGEGFAARAALKELGQELIEKAWHHTGTELVQSITREGLRPGSYATPNVLSPLQAKIELALPGNLPRNSVLEVDVAGLRNAGYQIPDVTRVSSYAGLPGGGYEMHFPYAIPPEFLKVIQ